MACKEITGTSGCCRPARRPAGRCLPPTVAPVGRRVALRRPMLQTERRGPSPVRYANSAGVACRKHRKSCLLNELWRKGWDSNPRWACTHGGFQDRCLKPLGHPSRQLRLARARCWRRCGGGGAPDAVPGALIQVCHVRRDSLPGAEGRPRHPGHDRRRAMPQQAAFRQATCHARPPGTCRCRPGRPDAAVGAVFTLPGGTPCRHGAAYRRRRRRRRR